MYTTTPSKIPDSDVDPLRREEANASETLLRLLGCVVDPTNTMKVRKQSRRRTKPLQIADAASPACGACTRRSSHRDALRRLVEQICLCQMGVPFLTIRSSYAGYQQGGEKVDGALRSLFFGLSIFECVFSCWPHFCGRLQRQAVPLIIFSMETLLPICNRWSGSSPTTWRCVCNSHACGSNRAMYS